MKKSLFSVVFTQLFLASTLLAGIINKLDEYTFGKNVYEHPEQVVFELWNKTDDMIYYQISKNKVINEADPILELEPKHADYKLISQLDINDAKTYLHFFDQNGQLQESYKFPRKKKILVRLKKDKKSNVTIFGPQTGALHGASNNTDSGISRKGNVKQRDIKRIYPRSEIAEKKLKREATRSFLGLTRTASVLNIKKNEKIKFESPLLGDDSEDDDIVLEEHEQQMQDSDDLLLGLTGKAPREQTWVRRKVSK